MNAGQAEAHAVLDRAREAWQEVRRQPTMGTALPPIDPPSGFVTQFAVQEQITELRERIERLEAGS